MAQTQFITVTVQGTQYQIPIADANPPYGEQLQDYLVAIATALGSIVGPADISETTATVANNQTSASNIVGLSFDPSTVRAAFIDYAIYRMTGSSVLKEAGELVVLYDAAASVNNKWTFTRDSNNDAGVVFTITDGGQLQYASSNMSGSGYVGKVIFRARGILQS